MEMVKLGCSIFLKSDPKQAIQREFKTGDKVVCNDRELIIGERLGPIHADDQNIVYTTDDPTAVIVFGSNKIIHPLKRQFANKQSWGIKSAEYIDIDKDTGFAIVERLYDPLGSYCWLSCSNQIDPLDEDYALPISRLINWFLDKDRTPLNFTPEHLMFDRRGVLKCLKVAVKGPLDFNALVQFAIKVSAGNRYIFRYIMEKSNLWNHRYAKFYDDIAKRAICGEKGFVTDLATSRDIIDHKIISRAKEFEKEVLKLKDRCLLQIKPEGELADPKLLALKVSERLIGCYRASGAVGVLPEYLEKDIISALS